MCPEARQQAALNSWPHVDTPMSSKPLLSETKDGTSGTGAVKRIDPTKGIVFKRVFVTGASGFVGRTLVKYLNDNAICKQVVALARSDVSEAKAKRGPSTRVIMPSQNTSLPSGSSLLLGMRAAICTRNGAGLSVLPLATSWASPASTGT